MTILLGMSGRPLGPEPALGEWTPAGLEGLKREIATRGAPQPQPGARPMNRVHHILLLTLVTAACASTRRDERPAAIADLISRLEAEPKKNPPATVWRYRYNGALVWYVPPSCCDVPSELYDSAGRVICAPDGGLTGSGDGRCADFFEARTEGVEVWTDRR